MKVKDWKTWRQEVENQVFKLYQGGTGLLPDMPYYQWYQDGRNPMWVAKEAIRLTKKGDRI